MSPKRSLLAERSPAQRARITNKKYALPNADGRTAEARRWRDLVRALAAELGADPNEAQLALIKATATAVVASEIIQGKVIAGTAIAVEIGELSRLGNLVTRNLLALNLKRHKRGADPHALQKYLEARRAEKEMK